MNIEAFFKLTYGLYIVSVDGEKNPTGCVINTAMQVTNTPIRISVTIAKTNYTCEQIIQRGLFSLSVLSQDAPMSLIGAFGFRSGRDCDKSEGIEYLISDTGVPYIKKDMNAAFLLKVINTVDVDTHIIFICDIIDAMDFGGQPLTYTDYHAKKQGKTPANAPSYIKTDDDASAQPVKGYRCTVCGYQTDIDPLPADFTCPICGKGIEYFVKI